MNVFLIIIYPFLIIQSYFIVFDYFQKVFLKHNLYHIKFIQSFFITNQFFIINYFHSQSMYYFILFMISNLNLIFKVNFIMKNFIWLTIKFSNLNLRFDFNNFPYYYLINLNSLLIKKFLYLFNLINFQSFVFINKKSFPYLQVFFLE